MFVVALYKLSVTNLGVLPSRNDEFIFLEKAQSFTLGERILG